MAYPVGTPYGLNNFNDLFCMLGVWAGQNKANNDLFNMYKQYMQNQKTSVQSPIQDDNNKQADTLEYNKKQQPEAQVQTASYIQEAREQLAQQQAAAKAQSSAQTQASSLYQNIQANRQNTIPSEQVYSDFDLNNMNDIYKKYYDRLEALKTEAMHDFNKIFLSPFPGMV